jgi:hypothetical protein
MKTIRIKTIGQHTIIEKFDQLPIDPEATRLANREAMNALDENEPVRQKIAQKSAFHAKSQKALGLARTYDNHINNKDVYLANATTDEQRMQVNLQHEQFKEMKAKEQKDFVDFQNQCKACDAELIELNATLETAKRKYKKEHPLFAHPRKNELALDAEQFQALNQMFAGKSENEQIVVQSTTIDFVINAETQQKVQIPVLDGTGSVIEDFIGKQYFFKDGDGNWIASEVISELGVTKQTVVVDGYEEQAVEKAELTPEDLEEYRVQELTPEQKEAEKTAAIASVLAQAGQMKTELEIQGDPDALAKSQAWYSEQVALIEAKYN